MTQPTPESKPIEQDYHYQVDQQVSVNAFFDFQLDGETVRLQVTNRYGSTPEKIAKTVESEIEALKQLRAKYPRPTVPAPTESTGSKEPTRVPVGDNGDPLPEVKTLTAERMSVDVHDNKTFVKVMGKPWSKYGISVWPEVLEAAGLNVTPGQPLPDIAGWRVDYICKDDGKPLKVTRLLKP